ncbi:MAG: hypothetical protein ACI9EF_001180 [Pseudohongiellaceae bacterium]|jgi:hypothetical protein
MSIAARRGLVCVLWFAVGIMLIYRGLPYTGLIDNPDIVGLSGNDSWIALAASIVIGIGKGFSALKKGARRAVTQIVSKGESAPPWTIFSPLMYLLVAIMIGAGLALRNGDYDANTKAWVVGILYPAIGVALMIGGLLALRVKPIAPS